jgi:hypothetical protein
MATVDITAITETDPKKLFVQIAKASTPTYTPTPPFNDRDNQVVERFYYTLKHAADRLGVEFDVSQPSADTKPMKREDLYDDILGEIEKRKIDIVVERSLSESTVALDEPWREKVHAYVAHIRSVVNSTHDLPTQLKESILAKLNAFAAEVDRGRTRVQTFTDVFVGLCQAVGQGAIALTPAVRLGEKIIGALARLQGQPPILSLPPPEQFDLPDTQLLPPPTEDTTNI